MNNVILTITGPSASGKSTLESMLCDREDSVFGKVISHTTRPPRKGEINGKDYHFVKPEHFDLMNQKGEFVESAKFDNSSYGAHKNEFDTIFASKKIAVIVVEPTGMADIKNFAGTHGHSSVAVFLSSAAPVRYARLVDRFIADIEQLELGSKNMKDQVSKFARRLTVTSEIESLWVGDRHFYDVCIEHFTAENSSAVVNHVSAVALNALAAMSKKSAVRQIVK